MVPLPHLQVPTEHSEAAAIPTHLPRLLDDALTFRTTSQGYEVETPASTGGGLLAGLRGGSDAGCYSGSSRAHRAAIDHARRPSTWAQRPYRGVETAGMNGGPHVSTVARPTGARER